MDQACHLEELVIPFDSPVDHSFIRGAAAAGLSDLHWYANNEDSSWPQCLSHTTKDDGNVVRLEIAQGPPVDDGINSIAELAPINVLD